MLIDRSDHPRACPFYIVCDVSQSMWQEQTPGELTPFQVLSACVDQLLFRIESNDTVSEAAFVSVVSFASEPHVVLPLVKLDRADVIRGLEKGYQTNYASVFTLLRQSIEKDCAALQSAYNLKQPTVFFLTDGGPFIGNTEQPESVWTPPRDRLVEVSFPFRPHVVTFGFRSVSEAILCRAATSIGREKLAFIADRAIQVAELVEGIMSALFVSIGQSVSRNELIIETPVGMRRAQCPRVAR